MIDIDELERVGRAGIQKAWSSKDRVKFRDVCDERTVLALITDLRVQAATIARLEAATQTMSTEIDNRKRDIESLGDAIDALEAENARFRSARSKIEDK